MPPLWEVAVFIASLALVAIAIAAVRALRVVERAADQLARLSADLQHCVVQATALTSETRETMASMREMTAPIRRVIDRFEALGERAARVSAVVLDEVEPPIRIVASIARGARAIAAAFLNRRSPGVTNGRSTAPGEPDHA